MDALHHPRSHRVACGAATDDHAAVLFEQLFSCAPDASLLVKAEPQAMATKYRHSSSVDPMFPLPLDVDMLEMRAALALEMPDDEDHTRGYMDDDLEPLALNHHHNHDHQHARTASEDSEDAYSGNSSAGGGFSSPPSAMASSPTPSTASRSSVSSSSTANMFRKNPLPAEVLAHMPLPPRSEQSDQRERNRLIVKRCYYKKITTLNELRGELDRVERKYEQLLQQKQAESAFPTTAAEYERRKTRAQQLHASYVEIALLSDSLRRENEELKRAEAEYNKMEKQMAQLQLAQAKSMQQQRLAHELKRKNPIVELQELSAHECRAIAMAAYARITDFRESKNIFTTGANIFGWRDRHCVQNDKLMFILEKTFASAAPEFIASTMWSVLSRAEPLAKIYTPHLDVLYHEVQRVDDDNVVFFHTLERPGSDLRIKALMLASRVYLGPDRGWLIVFRGLDPKKYLIREGEPPRPRDRRGRNKIEPQKEDIWMDTFVWGLFRTSATGVDCLADFGGIVESTQLISASWWMIEMLQFALRCEAKVVGPHFVLSM